MGSSTCERRLGRKASPTGGEIKYGDGKPVDRLPEGGRGTAVTDYMTLEG